MLSLLYSPTFTSIHDHWKTIALTRWSFVGKVISLIFNMLPRLVITFLPRSKHLLIPWMQSPSAVILKRRQIKNEGMEPKQKQHPVVNVTGDRSKIRCYKEQYCIGTWNVKSMNQGKLEVVKQEMTRVNIDILGISELRWTGMGEFNSDGHYIYYRGRNPLKEME